MPASKACPRFCCYALCDRGVPFYVGQSGQGISRARNHWAKRRRGDGWGHGLATELRLREMLAAGREPSVRVLQGFRPTPTIRARMDCAEARWIRRLRAAGHALTNVLEGGRAGPLPPRSGVHRLRLSLAVSGRPHLRWRRWLNSISRQGRPRLPETRRRLAEAHRTRRRSRVELLMSHLARIRAQARPVFCLDDRRFFVSVREAAAFYEMDDRALGAAVRGGWRHRGKRFLEAMAHLGPLGVLGQGPRTPKTLNGRHRL